jgi:diguanylate cyclase (GGDEF)-like protein
MDEAAGTSPAAWSGIRLRGAPTGLLATVLTVETTAALIAVSALVHERPSFAVLLRLGALIVLCTAFEEISLQVGKLRLLVSTGPQPDMTSVWTFAGALVLPAGYAAVLAVIMALDVWVRRQKASGQYIYRKVYSAATIVLACLAASTVRQYVEHHVSSVPPGLATAIAIVVAAIAYTIVNRMLIVLAAQLSNPSVRVPIIGAASENALELSTLCLATMTAIVLLHQPALSVLVLLPMVLLQRGALFKQLETAAAIDAKTGLLNAVAWQEAARRELARLDRERATAGLLLIDLDHFKSVNDSYGHLVGDAALQAVGHRLKRELRPYDVIGRFGGEEFVALLPRIDTAGAMATAERIRSAIGAIGIGEFVPDAAGTLAASVGLALYPVHGDQLEDLLRSADSALYFAKRAGRNRVAIAGIDRPEIPARQGD